MEDVIAGVISLSSRRNNTITDNQPILKRETYRAEVGVVDWLCRLGRLQYRCGGRVVGQSAEHGLWRGTGGLVELSLKTNCR